MNTLQEVRGPTIEMRVLRAPHPTKPARLGTLRWYPSAAVWLWTKGAWAQWYDQRIAWALWDEQVADAARSCGEGVDHETLFL